MKIAVIAQHDGLKPGAGKHYQGFVEEMYKVRERFLADGTLDSWTDYGTDQGPGLVVVMTLEEDKLKVLLSDEAFMRLIYQAEVMTVNWRWAPYYNVDERPETMQKWLEVVTAYG